MDSRGEGHSALRLVVETVVQLERVTPLSSDCFVDPLIASHFWDAIFSITARPERRPIT